jgi:hypothetical protein
MKGNLVNKGRCPICTLKPPCKHYQSSNELPTVKEVQPSLNKYLSPRTIAHDFDTQSVIQPIVTQSSGMYSQKPPLPVK